MVPTFRQSVSVVILFVLTIALIVSHGLFSAEIPAIAQSSDESSNIESPEEVLDTIPVRISAPAVAYVGQEITFVALIDRLANDHNFTWSFGDETTLTERSRASIIHQYTTIGRMKVEVIVSNGVNQGSASWFIEIVQPPLPPPPEDIAPSGARINAELEEIAENYYRVRPNVNFRMIAEVEEGNNLEYEWSVPGVSTAWDQPVLIHKFAQRNVYEVRLIVRNSAGSDTATIQIEVLPEMITGLELRTLNAVNAYDSTRIGVSVKTGTDVTYSFDFGDGTPTQYISPPHSGEIVYSQPHLYPWVENHSNQYFITIKAENEATTNPVEIEECLVVRPPTVNNLRITNIRYVSKLSEQVDFTANYDQLPSANGTGIKQLYTWRLLNGPSLPANFFPSANSTDSTFRRRFINPGEYLIEAIAKGPAYRESGCFDPKFIRSESSAATVVVVQSTPPDPASGIVVDGTELTHSENQIELELSKVARFNFIINGQNTTGITEFNWDFGDGSPSGSSTGGDVIPHGYGAVGRYLLRVTWESNGQSYAYHGIVNVTGQRTYMPLSFLGLPNVSGLGRVDGTVPVATNTPVRPTNTPISPTSTPVPPTATPIPPTATDAPTATGVPTDVPTDTPAMIPTNTAEATATLSPTPVPPTATPELPTAVATDTPTLTSTFSPEITSIPTITPIPTSSLLKPTPIPTSTRAP